jgi:hypothetical protein
MCKNATKTAAALMAAIEPTIKNLLAVIGQTNTAAGLAAIAAFNATLTALQNWQSGTPAQTVLELIAALQAAFNAVTTAVPISPAIQALVNVILAGIETVIGIVTANSPAPVSAEIPAHSDIQAMHQAAVAADTQAKVQALVPGFKRSIFHSPESQYDTAWNNAVDTNPVPGIVKV